MSAVQDWYLLGTEISWRKADTRLARLINPELAKRAEGMRELARIHADELARRARDQLRSASVSAPGNDSDRKEWEKEL